MTDVNSGRGGAGLPGGSSSPLSSEPAASLGLASSLTHLRWD